VLALVELIVVVAIRFAILVKYTVAIIFSSSLLFTVSAKIKSYVSLLSLALVMLKSFTVVREDTVSKYGELSSKESNLSISLVVEKFKKKYCTVRRVYFKVSLSETTLLAHLLFPVQSLDIDRTCATKRDQFLRDQEERSLRILFLGRH
jgi:hypothetical protein